VGYGGTTGAAAGRPHADGARAGDRAARPHRRDLLLLALVLLGSIWLLRSAAAVFIPLSLGLFITLLVYPVRRRLARVLPGWAAATIAALAFFAAAGAILTGLILLVRTSSGQFASVYPKLVESLRTLIAWGGRHGLPMDAVTPEALRRTPPGQTPPVAELLSGPKLAPAADFLTAGLNNAVTITVTLGLAVGVMILLLLEAPRWDERLCRVYGDRGYHETRDAVRASAQQLRRYLVAKTVSGLFAGGLTAGLAWAVGVPLALVWGVLSFLFNYIPNVGVFISGIPPTILAVAMLGPGEALLFIGGLVAIELVTGNLLDPLITGNAMILSPLEVLAGLMFWGWMWGVAGALLSVPLTAAAVIALRHLAATRRIGRFLSDT
jgi:AI-2 transport protein TqsA